MTENFRPTVLRNKAWGASWGQWGISAATFLAVFAIIMGAGFFPGIIVSIFGGAAMGATRAVESVGAETNAITALVSFQGLMNLVFSLLVVTPFLMGALFLWLDVAKGKKLEFSTVFEAFTDYGRYIKGVLVVFVYTLLWTLLFIIPGIIKQYAYSQTYYIMRENPEMSGNEARKRSNEMMRGHKWELFLLDLSFIGWFLLCIPTFGIGLLWICPYCYTARGEFHETLLNN